MKKKLLLILLLLTLTCLVGCGEISMKGLNSYVTGQKGEVGSSGVGATGAVATLKETLVSNYKHLESIYSTFNNLGEVLNSRSNFDLDRVIGGMKDWSTNVLPDATIYKDNAVTSIGQSVLSALYVKKTEKDNALENIPWAVRDGYKKIIDSNIVGLKNVNLDGSLANASENSSLNRLLTVFGYNIDNVSYEVYLVDEFDKLKENTFDKFFNEKFYKCGAKDENNIVRGSHIKHYTQEVTFNSTPIDADNTMTQFSVQHTTLVTPNNGSNDMYTFSHSNTRFRTDVELPLIKPTAEEISAIYLDMFDNCKYTEKDDNYREFTLEAIQDYLSTDSNEAALGKLMSYHGCIEFIDDDKSLIYGSSENCAVPLAIVHLLTIKPDAGKTTITINSVSDFLDHFESDNERVGTFIFLRTDRVYDSNRDILLKNTPTTTASITPFPSLPTDKSIVSTVSSFSYPDFIENSSIVSTLKQYSKAKVLYLKSDLSNTSFPDMSTIDMSTYTNSNILAYNSPFDILRDSRSLPVEINLLDNISESDATKTEVLKLYIGNYNVVDLYVDKLNDNIADAAAAKIICDSGAVEDKTGIQRFKYFYKAGTTVDTSASYILYGLYNVGTIYKVSSEEIDTNSHKYKPGVTDSKMVYNIFDKQLYAKTNNNTFVAFDAASTVKIYNNDGSDIAVSSNEDTIGEIKNNNVSTIFNTTTISNLDFNKFITEFKKTESPLILKTYLEGLYLPNVADDDTFACLGRRLIFNNVWFANDTTITETTPAFTLVTPTDENKADDTTTHTVGELLNSHLISKNLLHAEADLQGVVQEKMYNVTGIGKLNYLSYEDDIRSWINSPLRRNINTLYTDHIYAAEFFTQKRDETSLFNNSVSTVGNKFALHCDGVGNDAPRIYVWCTISDVNNDLAYYLTSAQFEYWKNWLINNHYANYLGDMKAEDLVSNLTYRLEYTYDIVLDAKKGSADILIETSGLEVLDDWLNQRQDKTTTAIVDIILTVFGIALLFYGILLLALYIIDIGVVGEGDGLLKKATFNRMKSVTGMSKAERKQLTERSEKGTYTIRAVNFTDVFFVALIIWVVATLVLAGVYYDLVDKLIEIAKQLTSIIHSLFDKA